MGSWRDTLDINKPIHTHTRPCNSFFYWNNPPPFIHPSLTGVLLVSDLSSVLWLFLFTPHFSNIPTQQVTLSPYRLQARNVDSCVDKWGALGLKLQIHTCPYCYIIQTHTTRHSLTLSFTHFGTKTAYPCFIIVTHTIRHTRTHSHVGTQPQIPVSLCLGCYDTEACRCSFHFSTLIVSKQPMAF